MGLMHSLDDPKQALSDKDFMFSALTNYNPEPLEAQLSLNKNKKPRPAGQNAPVGYI